MRVLLLLLGAVLATPGVHAAESSKAVILVLGDSLSAGYGLNADAGWVHLLKQKLAALGLPHQVANAAVSGETTRGGLTRLPSLLDRHKPEWVLIQLGANDGLRALSVTSMKENLEKMVALSRAAGATPVLFEMQIPSNYGPNYTKQFSDGFLQVAASTNAPIVPFILASFAADETAFQADGIHPNAASQPRILDVVWPVLAPLVQP